MVTSQRHGNIAEISDFLEITRMRKQVVLGVWATNERLGTRLGVCKPCSLRKPENTTSSCCMPTIKWQFQLQRRWKHKNVYSLLWCLHCLLLLETLIELLYYIYSWCLYAWRCFLKSLACDWTTQKTPYLSDVLLTIGSPRIFLDTPTFIYTHVNVHV